MENKKQTNQSKSEKICKEEENNEKMSLFDKLIFIILFFALVIFIANFIPPPIPHR
jgi:hypothetical protein